MVITIDGPAGAGKTTLAKCLAKRLGITYLDSGAIYRAITLKVMKEGINSKNRAREILPELNLKIEPKKTMRIWIGKEEVTERIRDFDVTRHVWWVSQIPEVRRKVNEILREFSKNMDIVVEGRDMGSVVFPHAQYKIYLTASLEKRAERRWKELKEKGETKNLSKIKKEIEERDKKDLERKISPLRVPQNSLFIDNSKTSINETVDKVILSMKLK